MKKRLLFLTAAIAAFAATGCNTSGSSTSTEYYEVRTTEESDNGVTVITEKERDINGSLKSETQKVNGRTVYDITDFKFTNTTVTSKRTSYGQNSDSTEETLKSTYDAYYGYETKFEVLDKDDNLVESKTMSYDDNGRLTDVRHTENQVEVLHQYGYDYTGWNDNSANPYYTYKEKKNGGAEVAMYHKATKILSGSFIVEWEVYANYDGTTASLVESNIVEKVTEFESSDLEQSYIVTKREESGADPVKTEVTVEYKAFTITN